MDIFRINLTEEAKLFIRQKNIAKSVNCLFYYYPPTQKTFLPLYLKNAGRGLKNHYMFPSKGSINNGKKMSKRCDCNLQVVS